MPKRFAGLFGAAPAVAIAGLAVTLVSKGVLDARLDKPGMVAGSAGMAAYAGATVLLLKRARPFASSVAGLAVWGAVAAVIAVPGRRHAASCEAANPIPYVGNSRRPWMNGLR